jgi:SAM-dependent methyltransferase
MPVLGKRPVIDPGFRAQDKTADERAFRGTRDGSSLEFTPSEIYPQVEMRLVTPRGELQERAYTSHLAFAKLFMEYEFNTVLDIGSGTGRFARAFRLLGKDVTGIDIASATSTDLGADYVSMSLGRRFDLVWCSHILEHQRNVGAFLDRVFEDLSDDGIAAISVPSALSPMIIGHPNIFTPMHLVYNLVLAGFDCRDARVKTYDWNMTVIVRKKPNGIRPSNVAGTHFELDAPNYHRDLLEFFPVEIPQEGIIWGEVDNINW